MQVRILGPVDVMVDGESRPVRGLRRKAVLAVLALQAGEVVSTDRLTDVVWGQAAPATAVNTLQSHMSYLRTVLGDKCAILAQAPGYLLDLCGDGTDVQEAERLLAQGMRSAEPAEAARQLRQALNLWRGRPLADVTGVAWLEEQADRLDLLRLRIRQALSEARLAAGEHAQLVPELEEMAASHPLDERIHEQLMLALYRSGRQADALAVYHRLRGTLDEELGIGPGQPLRDLEMAILQQDPALDAPVLAAPQVPVPAQLPPAVPGFTGRGAELASLDMLADRGATVGPTAAAGPAAPAAMAICAVSGTAGVGKTALAVHWAHRAATRFPDGQLYVNLRGFGPAGTAVDPGQALSGFLDALGVPAARIPADLDARAGLYRSLLAGKRVLVVLDNARSADQVRPLLPGSPGCLGLVTSRDQLGGLVATEGARPLPLDLLTTADARELLTQRLGEARVAAEPQAAGDIITACARLPLALTIAASRAATSPGFPLAAVAAELSEACCALDPFHGGDHATDVRAVFSWSYRALSPEAARLFRLLGLHPGPDTAVAAAASLAAVPPGQARALLTELTRAHLLAEHAPGRYTFHDLLRAYASELASGQECPADRDAAVHRLLDHYLHTASNAAALIDTCQSMELAGPLPGAIAGEHAAAEDALRWSDDERATLLAAVYLAADVGLDAQCWRLAWTLTTFLGRRGFSQDQISALRTGLSAARRSGDATGQAHALIGLGRGYARTGRLHDADRHYRDGLRLFDRIGTHFNIRATAHSGLAWLAEHWQRPADALSHSLRALELYRAAGNERAQLLVLNDVGYAHALLGDYEQALSCCERALAAGEDFGEHDWVKATLDSLGYIHHRLGHYEPAMAYYDRSIEYCRELADRYDEAETLVNLGDVYDSAGDLPRARRTWTQALRIFEEIDHPDRDKVRAKLRAPVREAALAGR
ncbi:MAG TPA: BTAD domain-containing putative transcriptional regulator [Streptosporangiaceae bacterium]|nr:BTAD domain-containing putative transcriptional regulator [Streptosporangiaceae bacterium]